MSTPTSGDLLLVNRGGVNYQIDYDDMSTLQDTDLLLVNRAGVNYQIAASDLDLGPDGLIVPSVDVLTPVNGAGLDEGTAYTPLSSAYVSTDTTPIYQRYFPELITTVSGGSWVDENKMFNGSQSYFSELTGAAGVVSQAVFTPQTGWTEAQTTVWAYVTTGGTVEVLDETDTVLRSYALLTSFQEVGNDIGIVRANQKIRFTTNNQNESLFISRISGAPTDSIISGRVAFEFTDDTDLDKMVAPIIQVDANGDVKVPTTSTVDSTTTIPGGDKFGSQEYTGNGNTRIYNQGSGVAAPPVGDRMVWGKSDSNNTGFISDNVALYGKYVLTAEGAHDQSSNAPELDVDETRYPNGSAYINVSNTSNYFAEIGAAPKVLDIISYTGNSADYRAISHNLGCKPGMIIVKNLTTAYHWQVWHKDLNSGQILHLNENNAAYYSTRFPSEPTSTHFYLDDHGRVNNNGDRYVAYVFAADTSGKIKCGVYEGSSNSQSVHVGFKAGFFLTKCKDQDYDWAATTKHAAGQLKRWNPNVPGSMDGNGSYYIGFNSNSDVNLYGSTSAYNTQGQEYVYLAISEDLTGPNSTQLNLLSNQDLEFFTDGTGITSNLSASGSKFSFASQSWNGNSSYDDRKLIYVNDDAGFLNSDWYDIRYSTGNKWLTWIKNKSQSASHHLFDSERNGYTPIYTDYPQNEAYTSNNYLIPYEGGAGYRTGSGNGVNENTSSYVSWNFIGAPQFFDIQKYIGNSNSGHTIQHDLGVEPGFIMVKSLGTSSDWMCYHHELGGSLSLIMNSTNAAASVNTRITGATASDFTLGFSSTVNGSGKDYISYIFAKDTPYVKCGKYTGGGAGGTTVSVGFKPRWVMIKCSTGNGTGWVILDKSLAGNNEVLAANSTASVESNTFYFTSDGFFVGSGNHSSSVTNGGDTYVYIAIADETEGHPPNSPSSSTVQGTPDVNAATMVVNAESFDVGDSASAAPLEASITSVAGSDGNTLLVDSSTGTWMPGLYAKGSETTVTAPSADEITFTSTNAGTTPFSGVDATLSSRTWTLESGASATGPWTVVDTYVDYDALASQDGATPWSSNKPALAADTFYRVKVQYDSTNAESVESVYSTFKTSA